MRLRRICLTMLPLPAFLAPAAVYARLLNALLRREGWARQRLASHSGKTVRFAAGSMQMGLVIQFDGLVEAAGPAIVPHVTLAIPSSKLGQLPEALRARDPALLTSLMHIQGDAGLASTVSDLARDLRWDVEEDMSRLVGDIAAARLAGAGRLVAAGMSRAASRLGGNMAEYISEESGLIVTRLAYDDWRARVQHLQSQLDTLEARLPSAHAARG